MITFALNYVLLLMFFFYCVFVIAAATTTTSFGWGLAGLVGVVCTRGDNTRRAALTR